MRVLLAGLLLLLLASCGFQLRGSHPLPEAMSHTYIMGVGNSPLYYELENAIRAAGGQVVDAPDQAQATLTIHRQQFTRRESSLDMRGRINEYEHRLQLSYSLLDREGRALAERETISVQRTQRFNSDQMLAMEEEREMLREEMERQAISQLLRRLQALATP